MTLGELSGKLKQILFLLPFSRREWGANGAPLNQINLINQLKS